MTSLKNINKRREKKQKGKTKHLAATRRSEQATQSLVNTMSVNKQNKRPQCAIQKIQRWNREPFGPGRRKISTTKKSSRPKKKGRKKKENIRGKQGPNTEAISIPDMELTADGASGMDPASQRGAF